MTPCYSRTLVLSAALLLAARVASAQLVLSAEIRPRAELRNGFRTVRIPGDDPAFFVEQRSRTGTFWRGEGWKTNEIVGCACTFGGFFPVRTRPAHDQFEMNDQLSVVPPCYCGRD